MYFVINYLKEDKNNLELLKIIIIVSLNLKYYLKEIIWFHLLRFHYKCHNYIMKKGEKYNDNNV